MITIDTPYTELTRQDDQAELHAAFLALGTAERALWSSLDKARLGIAETGVWA